MEIIEATLRYTLILYLEMQRQYCMIPFSPLYRLANKLIRINAIKQPQNSNATRDTIDIM